MNLLPVPPPSALPVDGASILVVEDEILIRTLVSDELRSADFRVIEAADADEAVAILKSGARVDLVLSDVRMPGSMDGLGLLAFVRQTCSELPVIITSGHLQPDPGLADGSTVFLPKPYRFDQAVELVKLELAKPR